MQRIKRRFGADGLVTILLTDVHDGDLGIGSVGVDERRSQVDARPWTWLRQVHGADVVVVTAPGEQAGVEADAAVSDIDDAVLAVGSADCAPVVFWSPQGPIGAAHAGWRGIEAGVIEATVEAMRALGASDVRAVLGPCIHPRNYEFRTEDLKGLESLYGSGIRGTTSHGRSALDVPSAVAAAVERAGAKMDHDVDVCTGSSIHHFSHRVRTDRGRQVGAIVRASQLRSDQ